MDVPSPDERPHRTNRSDSGPLLFVLGLVIGLLAAVLLDRFTSGVADPDIELVRQVRNLAMRDFVRDVDPEELVDNALRGMLGGLDEYSDFYGPEEVGTVSRETSGTFRGIGVVFRQPTSEGQVLFPFPGSPAARAGVRVGDRIIEVDGRPLAEMEPGGLQEALQNPEAEDGSVRVLMRSLDDTERELSIHPEPLLDPTVRHAHMIDRERGIGYIAILAFSHRTPDEFDTAVAELRRQGLKRLVLDLRGNPGGILEAAVRIANRFLSAGTIVSTRSRKETEKTVADPTEATDTDLELVVLVDGSSASASEVLSGALQDHAAAALVGTPTYGKGTVQTLHEITNGRGIVKLTTANYFTPSGRAIRRYPDGDGPSGIAPDEEVELDAKTASKVHGFLRSYSPPPALRSEIEAWEKREGVELFARAPDDAQLEAALSLFGGGANDDE
ncbi:MAG TPA: S41 family peptidase [Planctomycetes bacterium]|nr:S41 family peptidase [Planctomycetota bacterium]